MKGKEESWKCLTEEADALIVLVDSSLCPKELESLFESMRLKEYEVFSFSFFFFFFEF